MVDDRFFAIIRADRRGAASFPWASSPPDPTPCSPSPPAATADEARPRFFLTDPLGLPRRRLAGMAPLSPPVALVLVLAFGGRPRRFLALAGAAYAFGSSDQAGSG